MADEIAARGTGETPDRRPRRDAAHEDRLAAALRANLRRRKAASPRVGAAGAVADGPAGEGT